MQTSQGLGISGAFFVIRYCLEFSRRIHSLPLMQEYHLMWTIIVTIVSAMIAGIVRFYTYKAEQEREISELTLKLAVQQKEMEAQKYVTDHLTRAGEDMKKEFGGSIGELKQNMSELLTEIRYIRRDIENFNKLP